MLTCC